jgi:hypothetical protein
LNTYVKKMAYSASENENKQEEYIENPVESGKTKRG